MATTTPKPPPPPPPATHPHPLRRISSQSGGLDSPLFAQVFVSSARSGLWRLVSSARSGDHELRPPRPQADASPSFNFKANSGHRTHRRLPLAVSAPAPPRQGQTKLPCRAKTELQRPARRSRADQSSCYQPGCIHDVQVSSSKPAAIHVKQSRTQLPPLHHVGPPPLSCAREGLTWTLTCVEIGS